MTGRPFASPFARAFTTAGVPASGDKLYFYLAGGTTATDSYIDADLTTPHDWPVEADSAGRFPAIFINDSIAYRVVQTAADGGVIAEVDDWTVPVPLTMEGVLDAVAAALTSATNIDVTYDDAAGEIDLDADTTDARPLEACIVPIFDTAAVITSGTGKFSFRPPFAIDIYDVYADVDTAQATSGAGGILTVDMNVNGTSILSTKLTIDNTETTSTTGTAPVLTDDPVSVAAHAKVTFDVDQVGDGTAKGLNVAFTYRRAD